MSDRSHEREIGIADLTGRSLARFTYTMGRDMMDVCPHCKLEAGWL